MLKARIINPADCARWPNHEVLTQKLDTRVRSQCLGILTIPTKCKTPSINKLCPAVGTSPRTEQHVNTYQEQYCITATYVNMWYIYTYTTPVWIPCARPLGQPLEPRTPENVLWVIEQYISIYIYTYLYAWNYIYVYVPVPQSLWVQEADVCVLWGWAVLLSIPLSALAARTVIPICCLGSQVRSHCQCSLAEPWGPN